MQPSRLTPKLYSHSPCLLHGLNVRGCASAQETRWRKERPPRAMCFSQTGHSGATRQLSICQDACPSRQRGGLVARPCHALGPWTAALLAEPCLGHRPDNPEGGPLKRERQSRPKKTSKRPRQRRLRNGVSGVGKVRNVEADRAIGPAPPRCLCVNLRLQHLHILLLRQGYLLPQQTC